MSSPQARSDTELAIQLQAGDTAALGQLYDRHVRGIHDFLARFTRDRSAAEDLAQSTFLRAWERRETLRDPSKVRAWLYATAHNLALNHVTRSRDSGPVDDEAVGRVADTRRGPEEEAMARDAAELVWAAASSLEPRQYAVLDLSVRRGLSTREIADVMEIPAGHASVLVNRAREALGNAVRYLLVAQRRDHCERLAALVPAGVSALTAQQRSAVDHHMRRCESCQELGQQLTSPARLLAALLPLPLPAALGAEGRNRLVAAVQAAPAGGAVGSQGQAPSGPAWPPHRSPWEGRPGWMAGLAVVLALLALGGVTAYLLRPHTGTGGPGAAGGGGPVVASTPAPTDSSLASPLAPASPVPSVSSSGLAATPQGAVVPGGLAVPVATVSVTPAPGPAAGPTPTPTPGPTPTPTPATSPVVTPTPTPTPTPQITVTVQITDQLGCVLSSLLAQLFTCRFTVTVDLTSAPGQDVLVAGAVTATAASSTAPGPTMRFEVTVRAGTRGASTTVGLPFSVRCPVGTVSAATTPPSLSNPSAPFRACLG
ncbi:MAG TPA: sigma-70 family RNA polymerase sigma factor [Candidatus Dormibacteraeota bacterium]